MVRNHAELRHKPPIVIVTALGVESAREEGLRAGAQAFLDKPVSQSRLWDTVADILFPGERAKGPLVANEQGDTQHPDLNMKVLLVEDSEINQQIAVELLDSMGVEATVVGNGQEALDLLRATPDPLPWSMVFMDLQMPVMDGHQATLEIRKIERLQSLPIVAMTAHALREEGLRCLEEGMNEHLTKPIELDALIASLRRWGRARTDRVVAIPQATVEAPVQAAVASPPAVKPWLAIPGINSTNGLRNCGNKEALYVSLLKRYSQSLRKATEQLRQACADAAWDVGRRVVHTVKGTSLNLGASDCAQLCTQAELALQHETDGAVWLQQSQHLRSVFLQLADDIQQRLASDVPQADVVTRASPAQTEDAQDVLRQLEAMLQSGSADSDAFCASNASQLRSALGSDFDAVFAQARDYEFDSALALLRKAQVQVA
jgi:CheY-like chemotaxis protein/HPt (histidine-containing phosphotransfer) domain-containing protein